ncbi:MBL fold metallo-hydrolase [Patescibacteria group bacterium]|nr:MBL fold metallo-hydrolase [Patescibacteria group bacterium]MBU1703049.1 MBL fold metallo-hydrolase [Patescibacteria group bacterium]MBU1953998.1 MBL fold metallo-hydrolase [Patescibacteria group bacterium]
MRKLFGMAAGALGGAFLLLCVCVGSLGDGLLHVYYLDIGQGDSILVRTPLSHYVLIDGGPDDKVLQEMAAVMPFYERTIDLVILSHPHADHVDGLIPVLERYNVKAVMLTGISYNYAGYERFLYLIKERGVSVLFVNGKVDYRLGNIVLDIVFPLESLQGAHFENVNNSSISFRLMFGGSIFYFSGDLEVEGEAKILAAGVDLRADVLKAGHHGSRTSNSKALLDLMKPQWAVISCGVDNKFKHPHPETIEHFQERGIEFYRTDLDGRVEFETDGMDLAKVIHF